jgi:hypothetical protein
MLCWPLRFPLNISSLFPGGESKVSIVGAASSISNFRRALVKISDESCFGCFPSKTAFATLSLKLRIIVYLYLKEIQCARIMYRLTILKKAKPFLFSLRQVERDEPMALFEIGFKPIIIEGIIAGILNPAHAA